MKIKNLVKKTVLDTKKYSHYIFYAAKSELKSEVANSYLNGLWWILDPLMFMLVYTFVSVVIFRTTEQYFPIFVFLGLTVWNFFSKTVNQSVLIIRSYNAVISKVYIPKYMFILQKMIVNGFKMCISLLIVFIMMIFWRVPIRLNIVLAFPILFVLLLFTFGISCIVAHFGVYVEDLSNLVSIVLNLTFYISGIFYSIEKRIPEPLGSLILRLNPTSLIINEIRKVILYSQKPLWEYIGFCFVCSLILCYIGVWIIDKYENNYVKVS